MQSLPFIAIKVTQQSLRTVNVLIPAIPPTDFNRKLDELFVEGDMEISMQIRALLSTVCARFSSAQVFFLDVVMVKARESVSTCCSLKFTNDRISCVHGRQL